MDFIIILLLVAVACLELWVGILVLKNNTKKELGVLHGFHLISLSLWAGAMALYFGLPEVYYEAIVFWTRFLYFFGILSGISFLGFSYALYKGKVEKPIKLGLGLLAVLFAILLFFTDSIVSGIAFHPGNREVIQEWLYPLFFIGLFSVYLTAFGLLLKQILDTRGIARFQTTLILAAAVPVVFTAFVVNMLLPALYGNFEYAWIAPVLLPTSAFTIYYAIHQYRFLGICLKIPYLLSETISILIAVTISLVSMSFSLVYLDTIQAQLLAFGEFIVIYSLFSWILNKYQIFKVREVQQFQNLETVLKDFMSRGKMYISIEDLKITLKDLFEKKLDFESVKLHIGVNNISPALQTYFQHYPHLLVRDEIVLKNQRENAQCNYLEDLSQLGELCIPLYKGNNTQEFIGVLVIGKKNYRDIFLKEELELLEKLGKQVSLWILGISYNKELKKEVKEKTKKIQAMLDQMNDFILVASHELRTPLTILRGSLEELMDNKYDNDAQEALDDADNALNRTEKLVTTLLELQQLEAKAAQINIETVGIEDFVKSLNQNYHLYFKDKNIQFIITNHCKNSLELEIDILKIGQVLDNLFSNAKRHAPEGSSITLNLEQSDDEQAFFLSVSDEGEGISDENKEIIFDKFRSQNACQCGGIGLGLYISKKIIELHSGQIWIEDNAPKGARFIVKLPYKLSI